MIPDHQLKIIVYLSTYIKTFKTYQRELLITKMSFFSKLLFITAKIDQLIFLYAEKQTNEHADHVILSDYVLL